MLQSLDEHKGIDIVSIPLDGKSSIADFMVIASGSSSRQVAALAEHLEVKLKRAGVPILGKEGLAQADWVLLDTAEVIVHLLRPEVRDFYSLERMWDTVTPRDVRNRRLCLSCTTGAGATGAEIARTGS